MYQKITLYKQNVAIQKVTKLENNLFRKTCITKFLNELKISTKE